MTTPDITAIARGLTKAITFIEALANNDPDEPIADNGMTVLGLLQFQAPALVVELRAVRAALAKENGDG